MSNNWKLLSSRTAYKNSWLHVREDSVINPIGEKTIYGVVNLVSDVAYVVAINKSSEICLLNMFRYPLQADSWELIAGYCDEDEPEVAAKRELIEESGFSAGSISKIGEFYIDTGLSPNKAHIFIARELNHETNILDKLDSILEVKFFSESEIIKMIKNGILKDGHSIAACMMAINHIKGE